MKKKLSILDIKNKVAKKEKISWITSYSYPMAYCAEQAGIDMILVGDSGGMTELGYETTNPVTMDEMITFCKAVRRGAPNTFIVGDMPQGSYEASNEDAINNAIKFIKEGGCDAVKLEGGERILQRIKAIKSAGIIVCGHLGLTPQTTANFGGYRVQGKDFETLSQLKQDIEAIHYHIDFLLIEAVPDLPMEYIKTSVNITIPVFGIGAGKNVDGQLLIVHDILGFYPNFKPRFAKNYFQLVSKLTPKETMIEMITESIRWFINEVKDGEFPKADHTYKISSEFSKELKLVIEKRKSQNELPNYR